MKKFLLPLIFSSLLSFQTAYPIGLSLMTARPIYEPGDTILVTAKLYNEYEYEINVTLNYGLSGSKGEIPTSVVPALLNLNAHETMKVTLYKVFVSEDFPADEYNVVVQAKVNNVMEDERDITFRVAGTLKQMTAEVRLCVDRECDKEARVFLLNKEIFIQGSSSERGTKMSGTITHPDGDKEPIDLPAVFEPKKRGYYSVEVITTKAGFKSVGREIRFSVAAEDANIAEVSTIARIKGQGWERFIGKNVVIEGIFVDDPIPMLVDKLHRVLLNTPIPADKYILLSGDIANRMNAGEFGGAKLKVTGTVVAIDDTLEYLKEYVSLKILDYTVIDRYKQYNPGSIKINLNPNPKPNRYAILFSGGIKPSANYQRYWNDLKFMYSTLINKCGFPKNNFAILYANGKAKDKQMPVHYSATQINLQKVFNLLRQNSTSQDMVFVFMTNHGGGFYKKDPDKLYNWYGGELDDGGDEGIETIIEKDYNLDLNNDLDKFDQVAWDESLNSWGGEIIDDDLTGMFANIKFNRMIVLMEQCFSGGLIRDISQPGGNQIIMAAAHQYEPSEAMPPSYTYNEFSYHFTCALNGADPTSKKVSADSNNDKKISMVEAFNYARSKDTRPETPQYEDSGDGNASSGKMPKAGEGKLGSKTHF